MANGIATHHVEGHGGMARALTSPSVITLRSPPPALLQQADDVDIPGPGRRVAPMDLDEVDPPSRRPHLPTGTSEVANADPAPPVPPG